MEAGIATLICYAGVFGDVIGIEDMASRLGVAGQDEFHTALNELHRRGRILIRDGSAALPDLDEPLRLKASKREMTEQLIHARRADLEKLGRNPLIKFIGISGSLAAQNPSRDHNNHLDLDVFVITRNQCLWLYQIPLSTRIMFVRDRKEPELCFNFLMDESSLEVINKNLFTATDIRNVVTISGSQTFSRFLTVNSWVDYYYPGFSTSSGPAIPLHRRYSGALVNKSLYVFHALLRCIKHSSFTPLRELSFRMDPSKSFNYCRISPRLGGYQSMVHRKFSRLSAQWFPDLLDAELIGKLFPGEASPVSTGTVAESVGLDAEVGLMFNSKYG